MSLEGFYMKLNQNKYRYRSKTSEILCSEQSYGYTAFTEICFSNKTIDENTFSLLLVEFGRFLENICHFICIALIDLKTNTTQCFNDFIILGILFTKEESNRNRSEFDSSTSSEHPTILPKIGT